MSIDIVNLIESNPITKLNGNYQSKLIEKMNHYFNSYEQQMFLSSFYCYLKYDKQNDFVIDLDNVWKWLGFQQKYHAKYLLEKQFIINKDYKFFAPEVSVAKKNTRGGHNKEIIMLNIDTFKKLCLKAGTKKADEIHDYFIKLENLLQEILLEESNELKQQLLELENKKEKEYQEKLEKTKMLEREKILLNEYDTIGSIVYIIRVKTLENGKYVIKIGESRRGITNRYKEHKNKYEECLLLDCFKIERSKDFENFLHTHDLIRKDRVTDLPGHEKELELFLIGKNLSYQLLLNIIQHNLKFFDQKDTYQLELEIEKLKLMVEMKDSKSTVEPIQELLQEMKKITTKIDHLEKSQSELKEKIMQSQNKVTNGFRQPLVTLGPRLQKIHPETFQLLRVYECVSEVMKEDSSMKRPSINKAVLENTVYRGFRWLFVDRELNPNIIHHLPSTKATKNQNVGYIAQLNKEKTKIVNVYLDRKTAANKNGFTSFSALDIPVKKGTIVKGFYYCLYEECSDFLKQNFESIYGKPILYKNGVGQYNMEQKLVKEFICKYDCIKSLSISDKTLSKAMNQNIPYQQYFYKCLPNKLSIL